MSLANESSSIPCGDSDSNQESQTSETFGDYIAGANSVLVI